MGKPEEKRPLERPRRRWEDNIKMNLRDVGCDAGDWIDLAEDHRTSRGLPSTAVGQVVACAPVTQRARVRSPVWTSFLGEIFLDFSSPVRQMSGSFSPPPKVPE